MVLRAERLRKEFPSNGRTLVVLDDASLELAAGDTCALVGPSGSGKTTLLGICAGLDVPTSGRVELLGRDLFSLSEEERARLRLEQTGFVFQSFHLIPTLTAFENVALPLEIRGLRDAEDRAAFWLERVGLKDRMRHTPPRLSGGEQQRVAIARAFAGNPRLLFADEPTGNLDAVTGGRIIDLLFELNSSAHATLLLVTHDPEIATRCRRVIRLKAGRIESMETA
ncbi:MAG: ABC transporter ATP-binding protein [Kiritimatiellae bacterium]|nr:ABC transporter ATP-binding protein [Kiritimatiellia bacterium]MDW8457867.1 ABC transporter ATP-binding protein [Verrucomicrobiota bacterium]